MLGGDASSAEWALTMATGAHAVSTLGARAHVSAGKEDSIDLTCEAADAVHFRRHCAAIALATVHRGV